jgi:hypothetical protein
MREHRGPKPSPLIGRATNAARSESVVNDSSTPPTLGECLAERIIENGHTHEEAAIALGTLTLNVRWWSIDSHIPGPDDYEGLMAYLDVDLSALKGLILQSQMCHAQRHLRGMSA